MKTRTEKTERPRKRTDNLERIALAAPGYIGSVTSLALHTIGFVGIFALQWFGFSFDQILLILTTVVSLEAIYLAIFIQMTVNRQAAQIEEVSEEVEELSENVEDISEDVEEISKDIDTIQEGVKEIGEEVEDISEDVEELGEEIEKDDKEDAAERSQDMKRVERLETVLEELLTEVRGMKK
ncbi:MAG: DUF1003 domain-containing protein [Candidatus Moranbacteria bacterium]|nr:DUF1003 domain-containing protein [Candidatus Moranbacteria bacterium]